MTEERMRDTALVQRSNFGKEGIRMFMLYGKGQ